MGNNVFELSIPAIGETQSVSIEVEEDYVCQYCDDEITLEQIKKSIGGTVTSKRVTNINKVLPYLNKYRKDFGLDTCHKKIHFIAQVIHESGKFNTFEEYEKWNYWNNSKNKANSLPGVFSNSKIEFDETMGMSLKEHLTEIFIFKDKDGQVLAKTNEQIKKTLIDEKVKVVDKKLYTNYQKGGKLLKEVKVKVKDENGNEIEQVKYKIFLQNHSHFGIPLLSRMYAPYTGDTRGLGNGDELTRDGWKFKGRGLKQLTGVGNYNSFTIYRNKSSFPDDTSGEIDFSENDDTSSPQDVKKGNYVKVAEPIYAVQSALYFWNEGTKYNSKYAVELAEDDDIVAVSKAVNRYDTGGLVYRKKYYKNARKKEAFDIVRHYKDIYDNGTDAQKEDAKAYFEKWKDDDSEVKKILDEINEAEENDSGAEGTSNTPSN
ncbi:MAG: hypothetical protein L3J20_00955 [Flavobacteriaceae bacterium]|nr:hypothetical protein [Flavobacteriaceae bacterium]